MNLDLFKNIAEQIKKDNNVKEFMQDLSNSLENPNQSQELQENRKEGHLYLVTEDRNGEVYLWDFTDKPKHEFKEVITSDELLKESEIEIEKGEGIKSDIAFEELRHKFGY